MSKQKILINAKEGANNPEAATIPFILAVTASRSAETAVFVSSDASMLMVRGNAEQIQAKGYEPLAGLMGDYLANGGKIWLCPACAKAKGLDASDLIEGVEIAGAPRTMAYLAEGAQLLA